MVALITGLVGIAMASSWTDASCWNRACFDSNRRWRSQRYHALDEVWARDETVVPPSRTGVYCYKTALNPCANSTRLGFRIGSDN